MRKQSWRLQGWEIGLQEWYLERGLGPAGVACRGLRRRCDISLEATVEAKSLAMVNVYLGIADV